LEDKLVEAGKFRAGASVEDVGAVLYFSSLGSTRRKKIPNVTTIKIHPSPEIRQVEFPNLIRALGSSARGSPNEKGRRDIGDAFCFIAPGENH